MNPNVNYKQCPTCGQGGVGGVTVVQQVWWGGWLGPRIFSLVKCKNCGTVYNIKKGHNAKRYSDIAIVLTIVSVILFILPFTLLEPLYKAAEPAAIERLRTEYTKGNCSEVVSIVTTRPEITSKSNDIRTQVEICAIYNEASKAESDNQYLAALKSYDTLLTSHPDLPFLDQVRMKQEAIIVKIANTGSVEGENVLKTMAQQVCAGNMNADRRFFARSSDKKLAVSNQDFSLEELAASVPGEAYYVICLEESKNVIEICNYNSGYTLERVRIDWIVRVINISDNTVFKRTTIQGEHPHSCPPVIKIPNDNPQTIGFPEPKKLKEWLKGVFL